MNSANRTRLRNRLIAFLNEKTSLGCKVHRGPFSGVIRGRTRRDKYLSRLIMGTAKDGRTIALYPILDRKEQIPRVVCEFLKETEDRKGIVGTPKSIGDCYVIVIDCPEEYPRKKHNSIHQYWLEKWEKKDGRTADDSEE